jgi:hypothetical protein
MMLLQLIKITRQTAPKARAPVLRALIPRSRHTDDTIRAARVAMRAVPLLAALLGLLGLPPGVSAFEEYCDSLGEGPDSMLEGYVYGACEKTALVCARPLRIVLRDLLCVLLHLPPSNLLTGWNCSKRGQVHDVAIYNPSKTHISVYSTDGNDCEAAPWPSGGPARSFSYYESAPRSNSIASKRA